MPSFMGRFLGVIPFRKAIDSMVAYCKQKSEPQPMRDEHFKSENLDTITFQLQQIPNFSFQM